MSLEDELKALESEYYRVSYDIQFSKYAGKWIGKVRLRRKDTDEVVKGGFRIVGDDERQLTTAIREKLDSIKCVINSLGAPLEWKSQGRVVLISYLRLRSKIASYGLLTDKAIAGSENKEVLESYSRFWYEVIQDALEITRKIETLSKKERIDLLILPESVFADPSDPWSLDETDSRIGIIDLFLNPSEHELLTHQAQIRKLADIFHQMGWDKQK
jgi:hypothetical protein